MLATISSARGPIKGWRERRVGAAARGAFSAVLEGVPAGGPYRLVLSCGPDSARVKTFYCGDVWLLAGQSNMEGVGDMTGAAKPHPLIRAFSMAREWRRAEDPLHILSESPDVCHGGGRAASGEQVTAIRRSAKKGVGVGVFFAHEMLARSGVPQGLVATAHGGTSMAQWDPSLKGKGGDSLYGSMLLSLRATAQPIAGVLWYQGESDTYGAAADVYGEKMRAHVAAVRRDLRQPGLPWIMVQIATVHGGWGGPRWNEVQEQQRLLPARIKNLETVSAVDLPLDDNIHIGADGFPRLAARLARAADRLVYGNRREAPAPRLRAVIPPHPRKSPAYIEVSYDNVVGGLRSAGEPHGFTVLDGEGRPIPCLYKTTLHGDTARLHFSPGFAFTSSVRLAYGHGKAPVCTITDGRGCALPVFGPLPFVKPDGMLPFITTWRVSQVVEAPAAPLAKLACPDVEAHGAETRTYGVDGFINEHPRWERRSGHGYFSARLRLSEPMRVEFLFGYDGPFRSWIDGRALFTDLAGVNPCFPDESAKAVKLEAGEHAVTVAMDLNGGGAWGFFLRMRRLGIPPAQLKADAFARPEYA